RDGRPSTLQVLTMGAQEFAYVFLFGILISLFCNRWSVWIRLYWSHSHSSAPYLIQIPILFALPWATSLRISSRYSKPSIWREVFQVGYLAIGLFLFAEILTLIPYPGFPMPDYFVWPGGVAEFAFLLFIGLLAALPPLAHR